MSRSSAAPVLESITMRVPFASPLVWIGLSPALIAQHYPRIPIGYVPVERWGTPVQHDLNVGPGFINQPPIGLNGQGFNAINLALIPQPSVNAGLVLAFDEQIQTMSAGWSQRWTIVDPSTDPPTVLWNDELIIPGPEPGNLFCSGHAWTADGRLFVAGGTAAYGHQFGGAKLAFLYDPTPATGAPYGVWTIQPPMVYSRWYPTVTLLGNDRLMVSGGRHYQANVDSYEVFDVTSGTWEVDPVTQNAWFPGLPVGDLGAYPRMHLLSNGFVFTSGPETRAARIDHANNPGVWTTLSDSLVPRQDGASLLIPGPEDTVMLLGGGRGTQPPTNTTQTCLPREGSAPWSFAQPMNRDRIHLNAVLLPDRTVMAIGGNDYDAAGQAIFWKDAEWFTQGEWRSLTDGDSVRDYHSTAVLLPDGRILTAGGELRDWDWQLLSPPYFDVPWPRPSNVAVNTALWQYESNGGGPYIATFDALPTGTAISRAVLLAPGSTTHHSDMGARYVDLPIVSQTQSSVGFMPPFNSCKVPNPSFSCAPRGYYMLFLVTTSGVPSRAVFVRIR